MLVCGRLALRTCGARYRFGVLPWTRPDHAQVLKNARNFSWSKPAASANGVSEVVTSIAPLQYGDLAALGLAGWSPAGIIRWSFELLQVTTGIPWFYTIVAGTLFWKVLLIPSALSGIRNGARLAPFSEKIKELDEQFKGSQDRAIQTEILLKKQKIMQESGVRLGSTFMTPVIQVVGNIGLFMAVRGMTQLPVVQLTQSGVSFLADLTLTGDYVMPSLVALASSVQLWLIKNTNPGRPETAHIINVMRVATFAFLPMMASLPSGVWLSVLTGLTVTIAQSALLTVPVVRRALQIPPPPPMKPVTMKDTGKKIAEWFRSRWTQQAVVKSNLSKRRVR